ncbi:MAG: hydantoinase B/oxoprolinase family protein, partial [Firmicutes bacterium]|nr:hydantoinase B/oxoprolinase family protein [Bacillota bacterium]
MTGAYGVQSRVDPVTFNIVTNSFLAITQEMSADLIRTAYSTVIREVADASTCLTDAKGRILAQAQNIPLHLNSVSPAMQGALRKIDPESLTEDDVIILNDPYNGGQHLSDIYLFSPILCDGCLVGFSGSVGHYVDLGHSPGFNLYATDVFQERMRFPPMKFSLSREWNGGILEQLIRANVRIPRDTIGDLNAQLTANETGRRRMKELIARYGLDTVLAAAEQFLDYAEVQMRSALAKVPEGVYLGFERVDGDGVTDAPIEIRAKLTVRSGELFVDFTGTTPQVKTAINCPWASTASATFSVLKMILTDPSIPLNDGCYRPIHIYAPKGCILNPREYAPVEGRNVVVMRVFQAVLKALAHAVPDRVPAPGFDTRTEVDLNWAGDRFYAISEQLGGGYGAGPRNDGSDQLDDPLGNCKNTPVEALEIAQPFFRVIR